MLHIAKMLWFIDSSAFNHMTSHDEWFSDVRNLENPNYIEIGDDTMHPITQVDKVPLAMQDGRTKYLSNILHFPNITKSLVSIGQMVEQGLQVRFNFDGYFVEDFNNKCKLIAKGKRSSQMFTLDVNMPKVKYAMFVHGAGIEIGRAHV